MLTVQKETSVPLGRRAVPLLKARADGLLQSYSRDRQWVPKRMAGAVTGAPTSIPAPAQPAPSLSGAASMPQTMQQSAERALASTRFEEHFMPGSLRPWDGAGSRMVPHIVADPVVVIAEVSEPGLFMASPSLEVLPSGRLLAVLERMKPWGEQPARALQKEIWASDDGGSTWNETASVGSMMWPQIFSCASGVYVVGVQRFFSNDNNLVVSKMLDEEGTRWSPASAITFGYSAISINAGVDVSLGRVTKTFEVIPSMFKQPPSAPLTCNITIPIDAKPADDELVFYSPRTVRVSVASVATFVPYMFLKVLLDKKAVFFRVLKVDAVASELLLRVETMNLWIWEGKMNVQLMAGAIITAGTSGQVYGSVDWVSAAISADERSDLTLASSWTMSNLVGNPMTVYGVPMLDLMTVGFRADWGIRKSMIGFEPPGMREWEAWMAGFGSLYWMEGVPIRLRDPQGDPHKVWNILRVNNDVHCGLAAIVEYDDSDPSNLVGRFVRMAFIPGLAIAHPAIVHDAQSGLYWMASNTNRDALRSWVHPNATDTGETFPKLHVTPRSTCEVDRTTLGLFYSTNLLDWQSAGTIDYVQDFRRHFTYPHMAVDGDDLVVVSRAAIGNSSLDGFFQNHNSNAISFHRVRGFRSLVDVAWATYQGPYSAPHRKVGVPKPEWMEDSS